jgi:C-terminal processing protease CtpA/Prc
VDALQDLISGLFDHDVVVGMAHKRDTVETLRTGHARTPYKGRVLILIDGRSASAAELLARVVQLEHRGQVIGDRSAGAVMTSYGLPHIAGTLQRHVPFGVSVSIEDIVMADGFSLEKRGVVPDETVLPSASDLAAGRDPALARAAAMAGAKLTPEAAGKLFPQEWQK